MRAVLCRSFDGIEAFTVEDIAPEAPGPGEVRVRAAAVGVNFADSLVAAGQYQTRPDFPFSPGFECAGHIDALGPSVKGFEIGERVMAVMDYGAYREQVCVPAVHVYRLPESMDFVTAAGFPVAYGTSHIGLDHRGGLQGGRNPAGPWRGRRCRSYCGRNRQGDGRDRHCDRRRAGEGGHRPASTAPTTASTTSTRTSGRASGSLRRGAARM